MCQSLFKIDFQMRKYSPWYNTIEPFVKIANGDLHKVLSRQPAQHYISFCNDLSDIDKKCNTCPLTYLHEDFSVGKDEDVIMMPFVLVHDREYKPLDIDIANFKKCVAIHYFRVKIQI